MVDVCISDGDRCRVHERRVLELGLHGRQPDRGRRTRTVLEPVRPDRRRRAADAAPDRPSRAIASRAARTAAALGLDSAAAHETVERLRRVGLIDDRALAARSRSAPGIAVTATSGVEHDLQRLQVDPGVVRRGAGRTARPGAGPGTRGGGQTVWDDSDRPARSGPSLRVPLPPRLRRRHRGDGTPTRPRLSTRPWGRPSRDCTQTAVAGTMVHECEHR